MKRLLSTMARGLGPDALDSLVSSIQHAFEGTPNVPEQAWRALDSTMTEFGLSAEARHSVHDVVHTPIHWENVLVDIDCEAVFAGKQGEIIKKSLWVDPAGQKPNTLDPDLVK